MITNQNTPMYRSYDGPYPFQTRLGLSCCYLQIYEPRGGIPVVIVTEMLDNPGPSITVATEALATAIWRDLLPAAREGFRLIEVHLALEAVDGAERLAEVSYTSEGNRLTRAVYRPITRAHVEALIGGPFSVPFTSSFEG